MNEALDKQLCEKFPKQFRDRYAPMNQTCMCWGFEHGDGWFNIIRALCSNIQWHIDQSEKNKERAEEYNKMHDGLVSGDTTLFDESYRTSMPDYTERRRAEILKGGRREIPEIIHQVTVTQVKEKFGTLRFYYSGGDEYIDGLVSMAESMSACTCEECGKPGRTNNNGWLRTLCEEHAKERGTFEEDDTSVEP